MLFRERQQILICVVAGAMVGGFVLLRYLPLQKKRKAIEQAGAAQVLAVAKASAESEQLPALKEQLREMQKAIANYEVNIPLRKDLGAFLQQIANLMNRHNLEEQLIQPGSEIKTGKLNCIPIDMKCKGKLTQIFEFYKSLQSLDRLVRIEQIKLSNDSDFSGEVSMQTKVGIYCRGPAEKG